MTAQAQAFYSDFGHVIESAVPPVLDPNDEIAEQQRADKKRALKNKLEWTRVTSTKDTRFRCDKPPPVSFWITISSDHNTFISTKRPQPEDPMMDTRRAWVAYYIDKGEHSAECTDAMFRWACEQAIVRFHPSLIERVRREEQTAAGAVDR